MENFQNKIQEQFIKMYNTGRLYVSRIKGKDLWDIYLKSFTPVNDPIFRDPESSTHNCNQCNNFIRRYGNIIALTDDNKIMTIFDVIIDAEYQASCDAMSKAIKKFGIEDVFIESYKMLKELKYETKLTESQKFYNLGLPKNSKRYTKEEANKYGVVKHNEVKTFRHLSLSIPTKFIDFSTNSIAELQSVERDNANVLKRGMEEIPLDVLELVKDLITQGSLLDGDTYLAKVTEFISVKKEYEKIKLKAHKNRWVWKKSKVLGMKSRFRGTVIGTICNDIAKGADLNIACLAFNKKVDPANFMKATAPISQRQIAEAQKFVQENGYEDSFNRRFASLDDIAADEILHMNEDDGTIKSISIFDNMKATSGISKSNLAKGKIIDIKKFMSTVLPVSKGVELLLTNKHENNLVTLLTAASEKTKIFKWNNNYNWTYNGNLAGKSMIKQHVKSLGGNVDGVLRFSIMWADGDDDNSDLDAHAKETPGNHIYFSSKISRATGGNLDIDITSPQSHKRRTSSNVVENIAYPSLAKLEGRTINFYVNQFSARNSRGFKAEIEFEGQIFQYEYNKGIQSGNVSVATIKVKDGKFSINHSIKPTNGTKEIYGLETNSYHKVNLVCLSPNHWGANEVGNKHYFFMMENCKTDVPIRTFHNENLKPDLLKHRKVLEVLGSTSTIDPIDNQLSGLGFNATVRDEVTVRVTNQLNKKELLTIKF